MFPDIANVLRIREALWRHESAGNAAVMVGAGFSRNAEPASHAARAMPAWTQMAQALCGPLYPHDAARHEAALKEATGTSGFLRIAQEYRVAFGESALNDCIRALVPDSDYRPGDLHRRLLKLPWADIFSTNWDTLLERTCADVFERSYDVVRTIGDIPAAVRPRIVKLHGSFPGHAPFIFTEEDYRTYPRAFSPFVNLVQQSMMENIFCLVGFSGDDPNFLHWAGWVRDNLGEQAPRIYLAGWLEMSVHRRRMLETRNVMPIDLSALPQASGWPAHLRHRYATEWFLAALELGKPGKARDWPRPPRPRPAPPVHLGPLPTSTWEAPSNERHAPHHGTEVDPAAPLREILTAWRRNRRLYPGWIVPPERIREDLHRELSQWSHEVRRLDLLSRWEMLAWLGEFAWRQELALLPLWSNLEGAAFAALDSIDFAGRTVGGEPAPEGFSWEEALGWVQALTVALARNGRQELDPAKYERAIAMLEAVAADSSPAGDELTYQKCLWDLATGDDAALQQRLDAWIPGEGETLWGLRKAGLLTEVDESARACALLEATLAQIRRNRRRDIDDFRAGSLEGWALFLALAYVDYGLSGRPTLSTDVEEAFDRWRELRSLDCDSSADYHGLRRLAEARERPKPRIERTKGFDLDHSGVTHHLAASPSPSLMAAYRIAMLSDLTGIPSRGRNVELFGSGFVVAAELLADTEPALAAQLALRLDSDKVIDRVFARAQIARLSTDLVSRLKASLLRRLANGLGRLQASPVRRHDDLRIVTPPLEVLSRLAVRLPAEELMELFEHVLGYYRASAFRNLTIWLGRPLDHLFSRILESLPPAAIAERLLDIFGLPLPHEVTSGDHLNHWIDPVFRLPRWFRPPPATAQARAPGWTAIVRRLLEAAGDASTADRPAAVYRLFRLHGWSLLLQAETTAFADALWSPRHLGEDRLPDSTGLKDWVLLEMPEPQAGQAVAALLAKLEPPAPDKAKDTASALEDAAELLAALEEHARPFSLSETAKSHLAGQVAAWAAERTEPADDPWPLFDTDAPTDEDVSKAVLVVARHVVLPEETWTLLWTKAEPDPAGAGAAYASLFPMFVKRWPERRSLLVDRLRRWLISEDETVTRYAVNGSYHWLEAEIGAELRPDYDLAVLVKDVGVMIAGSRTAVLRSALSLARWLFEQETPQLHALLADDCDRGLRALAQRASYERRDQQFDVPSVRAGCFVLALAMRAAGFRELEGVRCWLEIAPNDPLPEVRNAAAQRSLGCAEF